MLPEEQRRKKSRSNPSTVGRSSLDSVPYIITLLLLAFIVVISGVFIVKNYSFIRVAIAKRGPGQDQVGMEPIEIAMDNNEAETIPGIQPIQPLDKSKQSNQSASDSEARFPGLDIVRRSDQSVTGLGVAPLQRTRRNQQVDAEQEKPSVFIADIPVIPPEIPEVFEEIGRNSFNEIRAEIDQQLSGKNGALLYEVFAQSYEFALDQQERVDEELAEWQRRAEQELYRLGQDWVTRDELLNAIEEADRLLVSSQDAIRRRSWDAALALLTQASDANPNELRADYLRALIYLLPEKKQSPAATREAEQSLKRLISRKADHGPALNSLANVHVEQRDYVAALNALRASAEAQGKCPEVIHNISEIIKLHEKKKIAMPRPVLKRYQQLHDDLVASEKYEPPQSGAGWQHISFAASKGPTSMLSQPGAPATVLRNFAMAKLESGGSFTLVDLDEAD